MAPNHQTIERNNTVSTKQMQELSTAQSRIQSLRDEVERNLQRLESTTKDGESETYPIAFDELSDDDFLELYLTSSSCDGSVAAKRIMKYHAQKTKLFEHHQLLNKSTAKISSATASTTDLEYDGHDAAVASGFLQLHPQPDPQGRSIFFLTSTPQTRDMSTSKLSRAFWYIMMNAMYQRQQQQRATKNSAVQVTSCSASAQFQEVVFIIYSMGPDFKMSLSSTNEVRAVLQQAKYLPIVVSDLHYCHNQYNSLPMKIMLQKLCPRKAKLHMHYGTNTNKIKYLLQPFGIPQDAVPVTPDVVSMENFTKTHLEWLESTAVQAQERQKSLHQKRQERLSGTGAPTKSVPLSITAVQKTCTKSDATNPIDSTVTSTYVSCDDSFTCQPTRNDVLFGGEGLDNDEPSSLAYMDHSGNIKFFKVLNQYLSHPKSQNKQPRSVIKKVICYYEKEYNIRFLYGTKDSKSGKVKWEILSMSRATDLLLAAHFSDKLQRCQLELPHPQTSLMDAVEHQLTCRESSLRRSATEQQQLRRYYY